MAVAVTCSPSGVPAGLGLIGRGVVGQPGLLRRGPVNRAGPDEDGVADAGEGGAGVLELARDEGQIREVDPGGLVGLLKAVDERAPLDRGCPLHRLDPAVGVGQPG